MYQIPLPEKYQTMPREKAFEIILHCKQELGESLVILGHHYQQDDIIQFADFTGDSLKLSQLAAEQSKAKYIVFCGVHFMAESADILSGPEQKVLLPDLSAGCSMADMADIDQVETCWANLQERLSKPAKLIPITYVNSSAAIKAFCGRHEGICCTSSNCREIFEWVWEQDGEAIILFLPDEHLGRNTGYAMGVDLAEMNLWDPYKDNGGVSQEQIQKSRIFLWKGFCSVHQGFTLEQVQRARTEEPEVKVIVHPECNFEVVSNAEFVGSTTYIVKVIRAAKAGSSWVVGTEINLVNRLAEEMAAHKVKVRSLSSQACLCETMYRIDPAHLTWILEHLLEYVRAEGKTKLQNQIIVPTDIQKDALKALEKMLEITAAAKKQD